MTDIWTCKIGETLGQPLPPGADGPMRTAVESVYLELTGNEPDFVFSGWGGELSESERAAYEDRVPLADADPPDTPDLRTLAAFAANDVLVETPEEVADAVLAAVLPEHRRQVLAEAVEVPVEHPASADVIQRATIEVGAEQLRKAIRRLASAAPETAPRPRHDDETAPPVPDHTQENP